MQHSKIHMFFKVSLSDREEKKVPMKPQFEHFSDIHKIFSFAPENLSFHSFIGKVIDDQRVKPFASQFWLPEFNLWESWRKEEADFQELFTDLGV